jgi:hypothetical protein
VTEQPHCGRRCLHNRLYDHQGCSDRTHRAQRALPRLYITLKLHLAPNQGTGDRVTGSREKPLGLRPDIHDHMSDIRDTLREWVRYVTAERHLTGPASPLLRQQRRIIVSTTGTARVHQLPDRDKDASLVHERSTWLLQHHTWLARQDIGVAYGEEIQDLEHRARVLADLYPARPVLKVGVPCRNCDTMALYDPPGSEYTECGSCGLLLTQSEYRDWTRMYAAYAKTKGKTA